MVGGWLQYIRYFKIVSLINDKTFNGLNIGNPGAYGFRTPETMRLAIIENMPSAEGYCHQKGIFPAREAVVMQQQARGVLRIKVDRPALNWIHLNGFLHPAYLMARFSLGFVF